MVVLRLYHVNENFSPDNKFPQEMVPHIDVFESEVDTGFDANAMAP